MKEFQANIWQCNVALAFTSLGVKIDDSINCGQGPYVFCIHGELCHKMGAFTPHQNEAPAYVQLYLHDPWAALDQHMRHNNNLNCDTMKLLQDTLCAHHWYAALYQHAYEVLEGHPDLDDILIHLHITEGQDQQRYNLPTADEITVIIPGDGTQMLDMWDIILHKHDDGEVRQCIKDSHPSYASLHYVLLFPYGEDRYHWNLWLH